MPPRPSTATAAHPHADKPAGRADLFARALAAEILEGRHPVGSRLPGERDLAEPGGVGVQTVRAALRRLEALGLVARGEGGGAVVISAEVRALYQVEAAAGGAYLGDTSVEVERFRPVRADAELAVLLDAGEASEWLHVTGLRVPADPAFGPLSWVDAWLAGVAEVPDSLVLTVEALQARLGTAIAEAREDVSAAPLTSAQARRLRARGGDSSLHIMRRYLRADGVLVAAVRDVHPAGRVSVAIRSRLGGA
jgi:DNA-binding GntR family transcriptional regulator